MTLPHSWPAARPAVATLCAANGKYLAMQGYESSFESYPAGVVNPDGPIRNESCGSIMLDHSTVALFDEQVVYDQIDLSQSVYDKASEAVRAYWPRMLICPRNRTTGLVLNYAGCHNDVAAPINTDNPRVPEQPPAATTSATASCTRSSARSESSTATWAGCPVRGPRCATRAHLSMIHARKCRAQGRPRPSKETPRPFCSTWGDLPAHTQMARMRALATAASASSPTISI